LRDLAEDGNQSDQADQTDKNDQKAHARIAQALPEGTGGSARGF
jgi:hypothetical protein